MLQRMFFFLLLITLSFAVRTPTHAQTGKPFIMPMASQPGPNTWLVGQPYGNTIGAYLRGDDWYSAGQRLHFGIDISMPCGTPLVAIGDGEVVFVDDLGFGSGPHNLLIRHPREGVISLYGHLLQRPSLVVGQPVVQGQEIALSGDPDVTCDSRPHLHLEIRSLDFRTAYNPVDTINANWNMLLSIGQFRFPPFQQDLDNARRWMTVDDQPDVAFGGGALNRYAATYPLPESYVAPSNPPLARAALPLPTGEAWRTRRLMFDGCCATTSWHPLQANLMYALDGADNARANVFEWDVAIGGPTGRIDPAPSLLTSADGTHQIAMEGDEAIIRRTSDGTAWRVNTQGAVPSLSTDNQRLLWLNSGDVPLPGQSSPSVSIKVANLDGSDTREIANSSGLSAMWLDNERVLVWQRTTITTELFVVNARENVGYTLGAWQWLRGLSIAPGGGRLMFYIAYQEDASRSGVYTIPTTEGATAQQLPWFGAWRWRDADSVYVLPFDSATDVHQLALHHIPSGEQIALTNAATTPFTVANGTWHVSADGQRIAFWNAIDRTTWLLEPPQ
jgi:murein DD-endopeptidase MepM/ murein hydrolase activator NlpD